MDSINDRWTVTPEAVALVREMAGTGETETDIRDKLLAMKFPRQNAADLAAIATHPCEYTTAHIVDGVPAATIVECGTAGRIPACQPCFDHFAAGERKY